MSWVRLGVSLALAACSCRYTGPCELLGGEIHDPTVTNSADWILARAQRPPSDPYGWQPYYHPDVVVTGVEAEISAFIASSKCQPNDPRLADAKVVVAAPSGSVSEGRIWYGETQPSQVPEFSGLKPDKSKVQFQSRLIFTPQETGLHTLRVDYGTEGVFERRVFVSQSHSWNEVLVTLPWVCINVERTSLGTWICDNHAIGPAGERLDFPEGAFVIVDGARLYVWTDTDLEVLEETQPMRFVRLGSFAVASTFAERHQLLRQHDRLLLVSSRELRLLRVDDAGQVVAEGQGATSVAPRPEDGGPELFWEWGVSYTAHGVLQLENLKGSTGEWGLRLCALDSAEFKPTQCVVVGGSPSGMNSDGLWIKPSVFGGPLLAYGIVDGGIGLANSYFGPGEDKFYGDSVTAFYRDGGYPAKPSVRRTPRGRPGPNVCGLIKPELDGGMVYHVYPEEELDRHGNPYCDASDEYVWISSADRNKFLTYVFPR